MTNKEKLEIGIYLLDIITHYNHECFDNIDEALDDILYNLRYEYNLEED